MSWLSTEFYHYKGSAPCRAVHLTLKALKVAYEEKHIDLLKAENKRPWFIRLNPRHTVPTIQDSGFVLWESRAIMQYLVNKYATEENQHLYPKEPEERGSVDRMLFFDMGTLYHAIKEYFGPKLYQGLAPDPEKENLLKQSLDYLDSFLDKNKEDGKLFLCTDKMTIADISVVASLTELDALDYPYKCYGDVYNWVERVKAQLPFFKECCDEGIQITRSRMKQMEDDIKKSTEKERKASIPKK